MIQPISAYCPRADFRGTTKSYGELAKKQKTNIALINASGVSLAAGGLTTAIARGYTSSWSHAGVLGLCGAFLAMFFMTPHMIEKAGIGKKTSKTDAEPLTIKDDAGKMVNTVKEHIKPAKKLVQFRQQS